MKKTTISLLIGALILLGVGVLLTLSSALYVTVVGIDPYGVEQKNKTIEDKTIQIHEILSASPDCHYMLQLSRQEFSKIDLTSYAGNVVILPSQGETRVELDHTNTENLSIQIVGDTLTVREIDPVGFMGLYIDDEGFSFKGLRQIFGPGNSANSGKTITIYVGLDLKLDSVSINSKIGNVHVEGIDTYELQIRSHSGDVTVSDLPNELTKIRIDGTTTSVSLENNCYNSCNVSLKAGSIDATLHSCKDNSTVLDVWVGSVSVATSLPLADYKLNLSSTIGSTLVNGAEPDPSFTGSSSASARISVNVVLGSVTLTEAENTMDDVPPSPPEIPTETTPTETLPKETIGATEEIPL